MDSGVRYRQEYVATSHINTNKDIDRLISETETTVTTELEGGDRQKAMKRLRVPPLGEQQSPWTTFKVGLFSGSFIVLFLAVVLSGKSVSCEILDKTAITIHCPLMAEYSDMTFGNSTSPFHKISLVLYFSCNTVCAVPLSTGVLSSSSCVYS